MATPRRLPPTTGGWLDTQEVQLELPTNKVPLLLFSWTTLLRVIMKSGSRRRPFVLKTFCLRNTDLWGH